MLYGEWPLGKCLGPTGPDWGVSMNFVSDCKQNRWLRAGLLMVIMGLIGLCQTYAQEEKKKAPPRPGPMLEQGFLDLESPALALRLVKSSQTVAALKPKSDSNFDFTPGDLLVERSQDGYYHLGDLDLRLREGNSGEWKGYSTALSRQPVTALAVSGATMAAADLAPTLPADIPLQITRTWAVEGGALVLRFTLKNKSGKEVQIGSLGIPMI